MKLLFTILFLQLSSYAVPKSVEVFFLSQQKKQTLLFENKTLLQVAANEIECIETEDGCFHPQLGLVKEAKKTEKPLESVDLKTINALETNLVDCKDGNYFDIFCGKAKKVEEVNKKVDYEIWIDTSSSLRQFDWDADPARCARRTFVERLKSKCDLEIKTFNTSIKQIGDLASLCITYGLNDQDRMISWIENSDAEKLIIVTDIDEASTKVRDYLFKIGAKLHGAEYGDVTSDKLATFVAQYESSCQKK